MKKSQELNVIKVGYLTLMSLLFLTFLVILYSSKQVQDNYKVMQEEHMEIIMKGSELKSLLSEQQIQLVRYMDERSSSSYYYIANIQHDIHQKLADLGKLQPDSHNKSYYERLVRTLEATDHPLEIVLSRTTTDESQRYNAFVSFVSSINLATNFTDRIILHQYELYTEQRISNEKNIDFAREITLLGVLTVFFGAFYFYRFLTTNVTIMDDQGKKDSLTGLYNKRYLEKLMTYYRENKYDLSIHMVIMDLDYFKKINDQHGHVVGDQVIKSVANIILSSFRKDDYVFRFGGEEFLVLLSNMKDQEVYQICERMRKTLESKIIEVNDLTLNLTITIGFSKGSVQEDYLMVLEKADHHLYLGKNNGRNQTVWEGSKNLSNENL